MVQDYSFDGHDKKGFSSKEIQRQLGLKRNEPVWAMVHKLRRAAKGERDARYTLQGMIESDEGYFALEDTENGKPQKSGRGSNAKSAVIVMEESAVLENIETGKIDRQLGYFKPLKRC